MTCAALHNNLLTIPIHLRGHNYAKILILRLLIDPRLWPACLLPPAPCKQGTWQQGMYDGQTPGKASYSGCTWMNRKSCTKSTGRSCAATRCAVSGFRASFLCCCILQLHSNSHNYLKEGALPTSCLTCALGITRRSNRHGHHCITCLPAGGVYLQGRSRATRPAFPHPCPGECCRVMASPEHVSGTLLFKTSWEPHSRGPLSTACSQHPSVRCPWRVHQLARSCDVLCCRSWVCSHRRPTQRRPLQ